MERLCSVPDEEAKRVIEAIGKSGRFHATALKTLKCNFGYTLLVSRAQLMLFDQSQIKSTDRISLQSFHQHLVISNTWLLSMGYETPILCNENLTKTILHLPTFLQHYFLRQLKTVAC